MNGKRRAVLVKEASGWVDQMLTGSVEDRRRAAAELRRLGVWSRGSVRTRGSLARTAEHLLPEAPRLEAVLRCLRDADAQLRSLAAAALGEWGGEEAAAALVQLLRSESHEQVQLYCVNALSCIGGATAVEGLRHALDTGSDAVRSAAVTAIEELATGGQVDDTDKPSFRPPAGARSRESVRSADAVRTRGSVRTRGGLRTRGPGADSDDPRTTEGLRSALHGLQQDRQTSAFLRHRAAEVLAHLED